MKTMMNTPVTHRLDYVHRFIPAHGRREDFAEDYTSDVPIEIQEVHIRQSLRLYAPGSCYILIRVEGTADEPLYVQPLNMLSLDFPEPGPGLRKPLTESPDFLETALAFWKDAKAI